MRWLAAGLTFVNIATLSGLLLGIVGGGLGPVNASAAFSIGIFAGILAWFKTVEPGPAPSAQESPTATTRYRNTWKWLISACFVIFAVRSFCWLFYIDGDQFRIQSPNNLGDLALHITLIKNFANGVPLWPDNPIFDGSKLRYPAGVDLFNGLLYLQQVSLIPGLVWVGLLGSLATFYALHRWGGAFAVAGFLFNGGVMGFAFFQSHKFLDYQGVNDVAWKSLPLSMFVTQRGLLYAIPAGLLLLWHWREKFFRTQAGGSGLAELPSASTNAISDRRYGPLPFWVELSIYASMPLFHVHTFLALSGILVCFLVFGDAAMRKHTLLLIATAVLPATFCVSLISDHFQARSVFEWQPGWVQSDGEFAAPFFIFWIKNFGVWMPLILLLLWLSSVRLFRSNRTAVFELLGSIGIYAIALCLFRIWQIGFAWQPAIVLLLAFTSLGWAGYSIATVQRDRREKVPEDVLFLFAAVAIFIFGCFVKTAPWGWDNLKLMMWGYFLVLPFLWNELIKSQTLAVKAVALIALFGSGFVSLFGGLAAGRPGYGFADRAEVDGVGNAVSKFPVEARFAAYPTYNHPLLLAGRKVVLGYPGHLWTEGFKYDDMLHQLQDLMNGAANWREIARRLQVRYLFWGREEEANYGSSKRPWEKSAVRVASGGWGAIYDIEATTNKHE